MDSPTLPAGSPALPAGMTALLKQATRELVLACGRKRAAAVLNVSAGMIAKWEGEAYPNQIPLWAVALLEFELQEPVFTRLLASLTGHALMPIAADGDEDDGGAPTMADVAELAGVGARAVAAAAEAQADGRWTPGEAKAVMDKVGAVQRQAGAMKRKLAVVVGGGR